MLKLTFPGFGGSPKLQANDPLPDMDDEENKKRAKASEAAAKKRKGFADTIKTRGVGVVDEANVKRKTLLGSV